MDGSDALERTSAVATASYLAIFAGMTVAFWFGHRRRTRRSPGSPSAPEPNR